MQNDRPARALTLLRRKVGTWWRMPGMQKAWLLGAFPLLGLARLAILILPFRLIAPWLGHNLQTAAWVPLATTSEVAVAMQIGRAVRTAARYTPWESKCLDQAMVARWVLGLNGLPYGLYLGVRKDANAGMAAHAWVCVGRAAITGGNGFRAFTVVGTFIARSVAT